MGLRSGCRSAVLKPARLGFFVELSTPELLTLLSNEAVLSALVRLRAGLTVALLDLSDERARILKRVSDRGIPLSAWVLVDRADGYFATFDNAVQVDRRVGEFLDWTKAHALSWERVGLDFEPDLRELQRLMHSPWSTLAGWLRRSRNNARYQRARNEYAQILDRLKTAGYQTETFQFPLVIDDRLTGNSAWQRIVSALHLQADVETVMLYSSLLGPFAHGLVTSYAPHAASIGIGSTGGGIDPLPKLTWPELERDLLLAAEHASDVRIFSLEGCVEHDFLTRLESMDWQQLPVPPARFSRSLASATRLLARALSRVL